ncbi:MAG: tetratricopeptide repeat protein [Nitrospirales bacterium]
MALNHGIQQFLSEGHGLAAIGDVHAAMEQYAQARSHYRESLEIRRRLQDRAGEGWMLHHIAWTYAADETSCQAQHYLQQASRIGEECYDTELLTACAEVRNRLQANT